MRIAIHVRVHPVEPHYLQEHILLITGVKQVLAFDDPFNEQSKIKIRKKNPDKGLTQIQQGVLKTNYQNMFKMLESTDYQTAYKGKWHITKPIEYVKSDHKKGPRAFDQLYWTEKDPAYLDENYGVKEWNYPDAGDDGHLFNFGGGRINNDGRFVDGNGHSAWYKEKISLEKREEASAVNYIENVDTNNGKNPFFLVVSLVNPHDVLSYPGDGTLVAGGKVLPLYKDAGYLDKEFEDIKVDLPETWDEPLDRKPTVQTSWRKLCQQVGEIGPEDKERATNYVRFYSHLTSVVDQEINKVLVALEEKGHYKNTLFIRISDHGDMGMAHGRQRQKMYNVYQQTLNVPMIFSHPLFRGSHSTESFAGLIDLMPTIAEIVGAKKRDYNFQGESLLKILKNPDEEVQEHVHFTFDDNYAVSNEPWKMGASHIRCIKQIDTDGKIWKYAVYFDPDYGQAMEYEMYNLTIDPNERVNLAYEQEEPSIKIKKKRQTLHDLLTKVMLDKGTMPDGVLWPKNSGGNTLD